MMTLSLGLLLTLSASILRHGLLLQSSFILRPDFYVLRIVLSRGVASGVSSSSQMASVPPTIIPAFQNEKGETNTEGGRERDGA
jgi:hypothetical protein